VERVERAPRFLLALPAASVITARLSRNTSPSPYPDGLQSVLLKNSSVKPVLAPIPFDEA